MAKDTSSKWGHMKPGKHQASFNRLVSPLGQDEKEDPNFSPSGTVNGSYQPPSGKTSQTEYARNARRG